MVKKEEREKRREKKGKKRKWLKTQVTEDAKQKDGGHGDGALGEAVDAGDDWEEMAREERMAKKMRKGDVSQKAFDAEFADF